MIGGNQTALHISLQQTANLNSSQCAGTSQIPLSFLEDMAMAYIRWKSVFVRAYTRFRLGRLESVCPHWRSHPGQMQLF